MSLDVIWSGDHCVHRCTQWILLGTLQQDVSKKSTFETWNSPYKLNVTAVPSLCTARLVSVRCSSSTSSSSFGKYSVCSIPSSLHSDLFLDHHHLHHPGPEEGKHCLCNNVNWPPSALSVLNFTWVSRVLTKLWQSSRLTLCKLQLRRLCLWLTMGNST